MHSACHGLIRVLQGDTIRQDIDRCQRQPRSSSVSRCLATRHSLLILHHRATSFQHETWTCSGLTPRRHTCCCHGIVGIAHRLSLDQGLRWGWTVPHTLEEDSIYLPAKTKGNEKFQSLKTAHPPPFSDCRFPHQNHSVTATTFATRHNKQAPVIFASLVSRTAPHLLPFAHILLLTSHVTRA